MKKKKVKECLARSMAMMLSVAISIPSMVPMPVMAAEDVESEAFYKLEENAEQSGEESLTEDCEQENLFEETNLEQESSEEMEVLELPSDEAKELEIAELISADDISDISDALDGDTTSEEELVEIEEYETVLLAANSLTGSTVQNPGTASGVFIDKKLKCEGFNLDTKCLDHVSNRYQTDGSNYAYLYGKTANGQRDVDLVFDSAFTGIGAYAMAHGMFTTPNEYASKVANWNPTITSITTTQYGYCRGKIMTDTKSVSVEPASNLIHIGEYAFGNMSGCKAFDFQGATGLTTIGANAFYGTSASCYLLPDSISNVGENAFPKSDYNKLVCKSGSTTEDTLKKAGYTNIYTYSALNVTNGASGNAPTISGANKISFTTTFDANGGSCSSGSSTQTYGSKYSLPTATRTGYTFAGWYSEASGGTKVDDSVVVNYENTHTKLYAHWTINSYTVTIKGTNCTPSVTTQKYNYGEKVTIDFTANTGYTMSKVTYGNQTSSKSNSVTFEVSGDITVTGEATINKYTIGVTESGANGGKITGTGSANYNSSYSVGITAPTGYKISTITRNGAAYSSPNATSATVTGTVGAGNVSITVTYTKLTYAITVTTKNCKSSKDGGTYSYGDLFSAKFTPNEGYSMSEVKIDGKAQDDPTAVSFSVTGASKIEATATINQYELTGNCVPEKAGAITGLGKYEYGSSQTIKVTPEKGYKISTVTIGGVKQVIDDERGQSFFIKIPAKDQAVLATFEKRTYTIKTSGSNVSFTNTTNGVFEYGSTPSFTFIPAKGYKITDVYIDDESIGAVDSYSFEALEDNHTIEVKTVEETKKTFTIAKYADGAVVTDDVEGIYLEGTTPTFKFKAKPGYKITEIMVDGESKGLITTYTFEKLEKDHNIKVVTIEDPDYIQNMVSLIYDHSRGDVSCDKSLLEEGTVKLTFRAYDGYYVSSVRLDSMDNKVEGESTGYTFEDLNGNHTLYVVFTKKDKTEADDQETIIGKQYHIVARYLEERGKVTFDKNNLLSLADDSKSNVGIYKAGVDAEITMEPVNGFYLKSIFVDGKEIDVDAIRKASASENNVSDNTISDNEINLPSGIQVEEKDTIWTLRLEDIQGNHEIMPVFLAIGANVITELDMPEDVKVYDVTVHYKKNRGDVTFDKKVYTNQNPLISLLIEPKEGFYLSSVRYGELTNKLDKDNANHVFAKEGGTYTFEAKEKTDIYIIFTEEGKTEGESVNDKGENTNLTNLDTNKPNDTGTNAGTESGGGNESGEGGSVSGNEPGGSVSGNEPGGSEPGDEPGGSPSENKIPANNITLDYNKQQGTVEVTKNPNGGVDVTVSANKGYTINYITIDGKETVTKDSDGNELSGNGTYHFEDDGKEHTYTVIFKEITENVPESKPVYKGDKTGLDVDDEGNKIDKTKEIINIELTTNGGSLIDGFIKYHEGSVFYLPEPTRPGYKFEGWYLGANKVASTKDIISNTDRIVARWSVATYTITYNLNKGVFKDVSKVNYNYNILKNCTLVRPARAGYVFAGWYISGTDIKVTSLKKGLYHGGNITLEAKWYLKKSGSYTVNEYGIGIGNITYALNGGYFKDTSKVKNVYDASGKAMVLPKPARNGYKFEGWYIKGTEVKLTKINKNQFIGSNVTLEAHWSKKLYTITYNKNKGKGTMDKTTTSYDEKAVLSGNSYYRAGYVFMGWNAKANGSGLHYAPGTEVSNLTTKTNVTLYAEWKRVF